MMSQYDEFMAKANQFEAIAPGQIARFRVSELVKRDREQIEKQLEQNEEATKYRNEIKFKAQTLPLERAES